MKKKKAVFNWSGGKDSALALYQVLQSEEYDVVSLLTTVNKQNRRSSMHGIPVQLLMAQAGSIGIPIYLVECDPDGEMEGYESSMLKAIRHFETEGVKHFIFGDIFLRDVRSYRENQLKPYHIEVIEPLWNKTTEEVMEEFLRSGLKTVIVTTMADLLDEKYIGRLIDRSLVNELPPAVDPCGENGEYHTFCFDGPIFHDPVPFTLGTPFRFSNTVNMDNGKQQTFHYWFANLDTAEPMADHDN